MLPENECTLFMKSIYQFDIYITKIHTYLNYDHYMSVIEDNMSIQHLCNDSSV